MYAPFVSYILRVDPHCLALLPETSQQIPTSFFTAANPNSHHFGIYPCRPVFLSKHTYTYTYTHVLRASTDFFYLFCTFQNNLNENLFTDHAACPANIILILRSGLYKRFMQCYSFESTILVYDYWV